MFIPRSPLVTSINLSNNYDFVNDQLLSLIAKNCSSSLTELIINNCPLVTEQGLISITNNCIRLTSLHLSSCVNSGPNVVQLISQSNLKLKSLSISSLPALTRSSMDQLPILADHLEQLDISYCSHLRDFSVRQISACSKLKYLNIGHLFLVPFEGSPVHRCQPLIRNIESLALLTHLEEFHLQGIQLSSIPRLYWDMIGPRLKTLVISRFETIPSQIVLTSLQKLILENFYHVSLDEQHDLFVASQHIRHLFFDYQAETLIEQNYYLENGMDSHSKTMIDLNTYETIYLHCLHLKQIQLRRSNSIGYLYLERNHMK